MSDYEKIIAALSTSAVTVLGAVGLLLGAVGLFLVRYYRSRAAAATVFTSQGIKSAQAAQKITQDKRDAVLSEWQSLYERGQEENNRLLVRLDAKMLEFQNKIDALQKEHLQCSIQLSAANTQIHEANAQIHDLREQNQRQEERIGQLENCR